MAEKRVIVKCNGCGHRMTHSYIPYGLGNPIAWCNNPKGCVENICRAPWYRQVPAYYPHEKAWVAGKPWKNMFKKYLRERQHGTAHPV